MRWLSIDWFSSYSLWSLLSDITWGCVFILCDRCCQILHGDVYLFFVTVVVRYYVGMCIYSFRLLLSDITWGCVVTGPMTAELWRQRTPGFLSLKLRRPSLPRSPLKSQTSRVCPPSAGERISAGANDITKQEQVWSSLMKTHVRSTLCTEIKSNLFFFL